MAQLNNQRWDNDAASRANRSIRNCLLALWKGSTTSNCVSPTAVQGWAYIIQSQLLQHRTRLYYYVPTS
eukprot:scaffold431460_cov33-Prasinocladus_malaysianus.AAC.1